MSEMDEKLNTLLSDPGSMARIMQLAQQLSGTMGGAEKSTPEPPPPADPEDQTGGGTAGFGGLGGLDPALLGKLLPLAQEYGRSNSASMQLLNALRPFLKPEKQGKVERAAHLARLIHLGKKIPVGMGGIACITGTSATSRGHTAASPSRNRLRGPFPGDRPLPRRRSPHRRRAATRHRAVLRREGRRLSRRSHLPVRRRDGFWTGCCPGSIWGTSTPGICCFC